MGTDTDHINPCFGLCCFDSIKAEPLSRTAALWMYSRKRSHHPNLCRRRPRDRVLFFPFFFGGCFFFSSILANSCACVFLQKTNKWLLAKFKQTIYCFCLKSWCRTICFNTPLGFDLFFVQLSVYPIPPMLWKQPGM